MRVEIKHKEDTINSINKLIDSCGSPKELAESLDSLIFDYLDVALRQRDLGSDFEANRLNELKMIRDFFLNIETTPIQ